MKFKKRILLHRNLSPRWISLKKSKLSFYGFANFLFVLKIRKRISKMVLVNSGPWCPNCEWEIHNGGPMTGNCVRLWDRNKADNQSQTKIQKLTGRGSRFKYVEFRHFALLFFRRRQNNVPRIIIMHVQSYFVARLTFSCWAKVDCLCSLLKFPIRFLAQNWKIINRCSQNHLIFANPFSDFQNKQKICKSIKSKFGFEFLSEIHLTERFLWSKICFRISCFICKSEIQISKSKSGFPNRIHPKCHCYSFQGKYFCY